MDYSEGFSEKNIELAMNIYSNTYSEDYNYNIAYILTNDYPYSEYPELYSDKVKKDFDFYENQLTPDDFHYMLSDKGLKKADEIDKNQAFDILRDENDIEYYIKENEDEIGLINIYRAISYESSGIKDEYENAIKYGGVGVYWTWDINSAEPHSSSYYNTWILHAKVKPEDIDYVNTIYKSVYSLRDEREIELNGDAEVLVYAISKYGNNKKIKKFKKPIKVPV